MALNPSKDFKLKALASNVKEQTAHFQMGSTASEYLCYKNASSVCACVCVGIYTCVLCQATGTPSPSKPDDPFAFLQLSLFVRLSSFLLLLPGAGK